jgi:tetratricopeptide (TPR) repeat protein
MKIKFKPLAFVVILASIGLLQGCGQQVSAVPAAPAAETVAAKAQAPAVDTNAEAKAHVNQAFSYLGSAKAAGKGEARDKLLDSAEIELNAALSANAQYVDALLNRGAVYMAQGKLNKAEADLIAVTKIDPKNSTAFYNLACVYSLTKKMDLASDALSSALKNGFSDVESLRKDPDLGNLRGTGEFQKILEANKIFVR